MKGNTPGGWREGLEEAKTKSAPHLVAGGDRTIETAAELKKRAEAKRAEVSAGADADSPGNQALSGLLQIGSAAADAAAEAGRWAKLTGGRWGRKKPPSPPELPKS